MALDGEILISIDGTLSFDALQMRLHPAESRIRKLSIATPARFTAFDALLSATGKDISAEPFERRRKALGDNLSEVHGPTGEPDQANGKPKNGAKLA